jgi:Fe-S oxidoreductase
VVAAANPGCLLQLASAGGTLAVVHPLELLAQAHR